MFGLDYLRILLVSIALSIVYKRSVLYQTNII